MLSKIHPSKASRLMEVGLPCLSYLVPREEVTLGQTAAVLEEIGSCGHTVKTLYVAQEQGRSGYNQREPPLLLADARLKRLLSQRSPALDAFQHRRRCVLALASLSAALHQYRPDAVALYIIIGILSVEHQEELAAGILKHSTLVGAVHGSHSIFLNVIFNVDVLSVVCDSELCLGFIGIVLAPVQTVYFVPFHSA